MIYNTNYSTIGDRIKKMREKNKLTQEKLADIIGVTRTTMISYEKNTAKIPLEYALKICNALECDFEYLCNDHKHSRKLHKEISDYLGISEKAIQALSLLKNYDTVSDVIESLFMRSVKDKETDDSLPYHSTVLGDLVELCNSDYGEKSDRYYLVKPYEVEESRILTDTETGEIICNQDGIAEYEKIKTGEIKYNLTADKCINAKKRFRLAELQLYDDLRRFIRKQRKKNNLTTYYD